MTSTNDITTKNLRPDDAELSRLLWGGTHHDPHSILGAHEYDDHTVIRVLRPNALEVVASSARSATPSPTSRMRCSRWRCRSPG